MRIENDPKLDFDDVLIRPKRSVLGSRKEVDLVRKFKFKYATYEYKGIPILAANMTTIATFEMALALDKHKLGTALHKHYSSKELAEFYNTHYHASKAIFYSMGILDKDLQKLQEFPYDPPPYICVDVANGYSERMAAFISELRDSYEHSVIMAGNVVTGEMVEQLILCGADIVKVGIGPGCLTADARVLMANGTYKNICDVLPGDRIITGDGSAAAVKRSFTTGYKKVRQLKNAHFHTPLSLTSDHKCFIGDLTSISKSTLQAKGYKRVLETPTRTGENKVKWKTAESLADCVGLFPKTIELELPERFDLSLEEYFIRKDHNSSYVQRVCSTYYTGYLFGMFLGDGNSYLDKNFSGRVTWYLGSHENDTIEKLRQAIKLVVGKEPVITIKDSVAHVLLNSKQWASLFNSFGKSSLKNLPSIFLCADTTYLQGLYDGLIDSDGYTVDEQDNLYNTSKQLIELFGIVNCLLHGSMPNVINQGIQCSERVTGVNESYRSFLAKSHEKRLLNQFQIIKLLSVGDQGEIEVPVYDLEIDDPSHSFIANNMIVHNSVCTTRKMTGVGYPQLSAIIECADAAHGMGGLVCADGGCRVPGDVAKAFGAGADFVMLGSMLAGHDECDGELIYEPTDLPGLPPIGMKFYGMSSEEAMNKYSGGVADYRASEGKAVEVPYRGQVDNTIHEILGGLRSACTYTGARQLKDLSKCTTFVQVNRQLNTFYGD